jgi:chromosomal replication initiator protein
MIKYKIKLNYDILNYIASKVTHSIRKLEGVMLTLDAIRDLYEIEVFSFDFVIKFLSPILKKNKNYPLPEDICLAVSRFFKINKIELKGKNRTKNISNARHLAIYLCRNMLNMSLKEIGFLFGKRDHTTIISSIKRTKKKLSLESEMKEIIELIIKNIKTKNSLSF